MEPLPAKALEIAASRSGERESAHNSSPWIDECLAYVGLPPGNPWCMASAVRIYGDAAAELGIVNPFYRTGSVIGQWRHAPDFWKKQAPSAGAIYIHLTNMADPATHGHCGIVSGWGDDWIEAWEGNTNAAGSREGDTFMHKRRPREWVNCGFIVPDALVGPARP